MILLMLCSSEDVSGKNESVNTGKPDNKKVIRMV